MNRLCVLAASAVVALGLASVTANAGVTPGIGEAAKSAAQENKAGVIDQVHYRRHRYHRRSFVIIVPRYYGYRSYRRW